MLTCENCGVVFKQPGTQEVVSARVLCPECVEKRRLEKAKRAEGQKAPMAAAASAPPRSAPAARPAAPARTAAKASAARSRREVVEEEEDEAPRGRRGRRGGGGGGGGRSAADQAVRIGFMIAGAFILIAIGVFAYTSNTKQKREAEFAAHQKAVDDFAAEMRAYDSNNPADAEKIRERADKEQALWTPEPIANEITTLIAKATATLTAAKENEQTIKALEEIEQTLAMAENKTSDDLSELRRRIERASVKAEFAGKSIVDRFKAAKRNSADAFLKKLTEEARAFVAANPAATGDALTRYKKAEDEITNLYEKVGTGADKDDEAKAAYAQMLKEIYSESNAICARAFTDAAVSQVPLRDLIQDKTWTASTVKGFDYAPVNGALKIIGPDAGTKSRGVMSIGDQEVWRDFVIDMTIERSKGKLELFFRAGKNLDGTVLSYLLNEKNVPANTPTHLVASVIGGRFKITIDGAEAPVVEMDVPPAMRRKGAFALAISPETEVTITKLGARVLR